MVNASRRPRVAHLFKLHDDLIDKEQ